jgi:hypothetical protein
MSDSLQQIMERLWVAPDDAEWTPSAKPRTVTEVKNDVETLT